MNFKIIIQLLTFLIFSQLSQFANSGNLVLVAEGGLASLDVSENYRPTPTSDDSYDNFALGLMAGYKFDSQVIISAAYNNYYGISTFGESDRVHVYDVCTGVGYSIEYSKSFRIVPMVMYCSWELDSKEGALFSSNPDANEFNGQDVVGKVSFELPFNDTFSLNISLTYGNYDFGDLTAVRVGGKFDVFN